MPDPAQRLITRPRIVTPSARTSRPGENPRLVPSISIRSTVFRPSLNDDQVMPLLTER